MFICELQLKKNKNVFIVINKMEKMGKKYYFINKYKLKK